MQLQLLSLIQQDRAGKAAPSFDGNADISFSSDDLDPVPADLLESLVLSDLERELVRIGQAGGSLPGLESQPSLQRDLPASDPAQEAERIVLQLPEFQVLQSLVQTQREEILAGEEGLVEQGLAQDLVQGQTGPRRAKLKRVLKKVLVGGGHNNNNNNNNGSSDNSGSEPVTSPEEEKARKLSTEEGKEEKVLRQEENQILLQRVQSLIDRLEGNPPLVDNQGSFFVFLSFFWFDLIVYLFAVHSLSGAENRTRDGWVGSANASSVLCRPNQLSFLLAGKVTVHPFIHSFKQCLTCCTI